MKHARRLTVIATMAAALVAAVPCTTAVAGTSAGHAYGNPRRAQPVSDQQILQDVLASERQTWGVPAMAGAVIRSNTVTADALGERILGIGAPVTVNDRFHVGSLTKSMTATMIATLVEARKLSWDSTPGQAFPAQAGAMNPQMRNVTLRQLLSHHAGLQAFNSSAEFLSLPVFTGTPAQQRRAFTIYLLNRPPTTPVGGFVYSNAGYTVAAEMAAQVTGTPWETLMQTKLLNPLGIAERLGWPTNDDPNQPWGHWNLGAGLQPADPVSYRFPIVVQPAGDLNMSVGDFARFAQMHLKGLRGQKTLIKAATTQTLHTPIAPAGNLGPYALGWEVSPYNGVMTSSHDGTAGTFFAIVAIQPARDLAVVVFANAGGAEGGNAAGEAVGRLLDTL